MLVVSGKKIDNNLTVSKVNPGKKPNFVESLLGTKETPDVPTELKGKAGTMDVTMNPVQDGVKISSGSRTVTIKPQGVTNILPVKKDDRTVIYKDAWPYVDLEYQLRGELVKEIIVIKDKRARATFDFTVDGGKVIAHPKLKDQLTIAGFPDTFAFSQLSLDVNERGVISEQRVTQKATATGIQVVMDNAWMQAQPASAFPMYIDPSFGQSATSYWMYKSDGYYCGFDRCYANIGTIWDANAWRSWRTYVQFPYGQLAGKTVINANMHGTFKWGMNGIGDGRTIYMGHASCVGPNCIGNYVGQQWVNQDFDINFTNELQASVNRGDFGAVWSFWGEEGVYKSYKPYDYLTASIVYDTPTPVAQPISPAHEQVTVDTQTTLKATPVIDPDGDAVKYYFRVSTKQDAETGAVINSGWVDTPEWTIPDGILQDGTTYYWHTYTLGQRQTNPTWTRSFKVNLRTGKDSTQSYDTVGPVGVDLATGNASLGSGTHSMSALGGDLGVSLNYATPNRAKKGLIGEYWNVPAGYSFASGAPTGTPNATRRDDKIDFNWGTGMPAPGVTSDTFYSRWTGQFVAPVTGSYQFGANADDNMRVSVNNTEVVNTGYTNGVVAYGGAVTLQAGQVVPIRVEHLDALGGAYAKLYVKGAVTEQVVPRDWLYANITNEPQQTGLTGRYYLDNGDHNLDNAAKDPMRLMFTRQDTNMNLQFSADGPAAGMQADNFMARWTGYLTAPTSGKYTIGAISDDGVRIKTATGLLGAMEELTSNSWGATNGTFWGKEITLEANKPTLIVVDYMEATGNANMNLVLKAADGTPQTVPATWLAPQANALPDAWKLGVAVGGAAAYEHLRVSNSSVILEDSTGSTHEYTYKDGGYKPPLNEDGVLTKNSDNSYTLIDKDGRTYIFDAEGQLTSLTSPTDDRQPAALKYTYSGAPSRLTRIEDGVTNTRYATLSYKNINDTDGLCAPAAGFDDVPNGMLCGLKSSDGQITRLYYRAGNLARVELPGQQYTDYSYDALGRIQSVRDPLAADAVRAGVRANDATTTTTLSYDSLGRIQSVTAPAPTVGAKQMVHTIDYAPGQTTMHIVGASEPFGYSKRVGYDSLLRTTAETDITGKTATTEWDAAKDLQLSKTDATGLKSTTLYDQLDRAVDSYGPAPASMFKPDRTPTDPNTVPQSHSGYDEGMSGLDVSVYDNAKFLRAPKLITNAMNNLPNGSYSLALNNPTVAPTDGLSMRAIGKIRLDKVGVYTFKVWHGGDGARVLLDNVPIIDEAGNGSEQFTGTGTYNNQTAGKLVSITIQTAKKGDKTSTGRLVASLHQLEPGGAWTEAIGGQFTPAYNLATSTTAYDSTLGNITSTTQYSNPAYGQTSGATLDPAGLNYQSKAEYEAPGTGFLRQTSKTLPGGAKTTYQYYGANDTADNPCTTSSVEAYHQAGRARGKTEPTGRTSETIYDEAGRVVAARYNADGWTCTSYDARGRAAQVITPSRNDSGYNYAGLTATSNYAVGGNPLVVSVTDVAGSITTESDLLGRTVKYTDTRGFTTTTTRDDYGKVTQRVSPVGAESFEYDQYDRLVKQKLDSVTFATITYDEFSRIQSVQYPAGLSLQPAIRDSLGRVSKVTYSASGTSITDEVTRSTSGLVVSSNQNGVAKSYTYDKADRLTGATIGSNTFKYEFGTQGDGCTAVPGYDAGRDSNHTKMTLNGKVTNYCYNAADQLKSSNDLWYTDVRYDNHGNTTRMGDGAHLTQFQYDALDRNTGIIQTDAAGNGTASYYLRDASGRIAQRTENTITKWSWLSGAPKVVYGYTSAGDGADFVADGTGKILQKYLNLPGGVRLTLDTQSTSAGAQTYSLSNIHGDIMATVNADGTPTIIAPSGPFGEQLPDSNDPKNAAAGSTYNYVGIHQKQTETKFTIRPIQMGARVYIPGLGRFLQVDPVEGGTLNNYVYAMDPVNQFDLNGKFALALAAPFAGIAIGPIAVAIGIIALGYVGYAGAVAAREYIQSRPQTKSEERVDAQPVPKTKCRCSTYMPAIGKTIVQPATQRIAFANATTSAGIAMIQSSLKMGIKPGIEMDIELNDQNYIGWKKYKLKTDNEHEFHYSVHENEMGICEYADIKDTYAEKASWKRGG